MTNPPTPHTGPISEGGASRDQLTQDLATAITVLERNGRFADVVERLAAFSGSLWDEPAPDGGAAGMGGNPVLVNFEGEAIQAHSKSQFKRLSAMGADVVPPEVVLPVDAPKVPEGYALVPKEPTCGMLYEADKAMTAYRQVRSKRGEPVERLGFHVIEEGYRAMLSAATTGQGKADMRVVCDANKSLALLDKFIAEFEAQPRLIGYVRLSLEEAKRIRAAVAGSKP